MKPINILRTIVLVSLSVPAACGGVSRIGSGDAPGKAGSAGMNVGGSKAQAAGVAGVSMGAASGVAGASVGGATADGGRDGGTGAVSTADSCVNDADCERPTEPCESCGDGTYSCSNVYCNGGECVHTRDACQTKCTKDQDCPVLNFACMQCGDGSKVCPTTQCSVGQCQTTYPGCNDADPCEGLKCGDECSSCVDGTCDGKELSYCNADGKCQPGLPQCSVATDCKTSNDCGSPPIRCAPCGKGTCAKFDCVDGACVYGCPPNPDPECVTTQDCKAAGGVCKMCGFGGCATQACLNGSCELVCPL